MEKLHSTYWREIRELSRTAYEWLARNRVIQPVEQPKMIYEQLNWSLKNCCLCIYISTYALNCSCADGQWGSAQLLMCISLTLKIWCQVGRDLPGLTSCCNSDIQKPKGKPAPLENLGFILTWVYEVWDKGGNHYKPICRCSGLIVFVGFRGERQWPQVKVDVWLLP